MPSEHPKTVSIVIPAYNEEATIDAIIRHVQQVNFDGLRTELIVVDDHSTDRTVERLQRFGDQIRLIQHTRNRGKGAAVKTGLAAARGDVFIIQDADLEYDPQDIPRVVEPIVRDQADAVLGSRFLWQKPAFFTKHGSPFFSHYIGNKLIIWLTNWLYGFHATDYEGCYKAFTKEIAGRIPIETDGFAFDNELICKTLRLGYRLVEIPIQYTPRSYEEGKKIDWRDGLGILWTIFKWRFKRF